MVQMTNYNSGELEIAAGDAQRVRLDKSQANRLILAARMHGVDSFLQKLPQLIPDPALAATLSTLLQEAQGTERWNLKEKFARLQTIAPDYQSDSPDAITETVQL